MAVDHSLTYKVRSLRNLPHRMRLRAIEREIRRLVLKPGLTYADFGCSNGFLTALVAGWIRPGRTIGLDRSEEQVRLANMHHPEIEFVQFDLCEAGSGPLQGDFVTCFETLEHVGNLEAAVGNLLSAIRPGGAALVTVPIEMGPRGVAKFAVKMAAGFDLSELPQSPGLLRRYIGALLTGDRMSRFRNDRSGWGTHFGFDYRDVDAALTRRNAAFEACNSGTTRFYRIRGESYGQANAALRPNVTSHHAGAVPVSAPLPPTAR